MIKILKITLFFLLYCTAANAQQDKLARIEYANAEEAYAKENFKDAIAYLDKTKELLGSTNPKIMYLEIISKYKLIPFTISEKDRAVVMSAGQKAELELYDIEGIENLPEKEVVKIAEDLLIKYMDKEGVDYLDIRKPRLDLESKNLYKEASLLKEAYQLSVDYVAEAPENTPLEKVSEVYKINKKLKPLTLGLDNLLDGLTAYDSKNYSLALEQLAIALEKGNTHASIKINQIEMDELLENHKDEIIENIEKNMVAVSGGTFEMNVSIGKNTKKPKEENYQIQLSDYSINKYEVTILEWLAVMGKSNINLTELEYNYKLPITNISRNKANDFVKKLSVITGKNFSLPSSAQWEFAALGGNQSGGFKYSGSNLIEEVAWMSVNSKAVLHKGGQKKPNELGLFDMSGNAIEMCYDLSDKDFYKKMPTKDPVCKKSRLMTMIGKTNKINEHGYIELGDYCRVVTKGGGIWSMKKACEIAETNSAQIAQRGDEDIGFRVAIVQ